MMSKSKVILSALGMGEAGGRGFVAHQGWRLIWSMESLISGSVLRILRGRGEERSDELKL